VPEQYPETRTETVVDEIHGVKIEDPYRWLEDASSEEVKNWVESQNRFTKSVMDSYPGFEGISKRLHELYRYDYIMVNFFQVTKSKGRPRFFYLFRKAGENQPSLCYQDGEDGERVVLFDPMEVSEAGLASVDWAVPSKDGSMIAFGVSEGGTEKSVLHVMQVETGELLEERIPQTKWCSLDWLNNDGFYYSRYPLPGTVSDDDLNYYHHVYYHKLGSDYREDVKVFGEGRVKTEHPSVILNDDCTLLVIGSYRFTSSDVHLAAVDSTSPTNLDFVPLIETESYDNVPLFRADQLYVMTQRDAPNGQIQRYDLSQFKTTLKIPEPVTVVKESKGVMFGAQYIRFEVFDGKVAVIEDRNASSSLKIYDTQSGELIEDVDFGTHVTVYQVVGAPGLDAFYYALGSYFSPASHYKYDPKGPVTLFRPKLDLDSDQFKSEQVWYPSKDGTKVSMFVLSKRSLKPNKKTPVTLTGYGGFGITMTPDYHPAYVAWVESGGVVAIPNLRGGGEYGQAWHRAGNRENKQNVFDDFASAAEWLARNNIGSADTISISGGSNGGLLVGAALVQHPELFGAVTCHVPLLDMIRYTNFQVAKTWATEYGDPSVKEEFEWIYRYSPYHHVRQAKYPATFLQTALGDSRVDSMHAFKMAAKLQATVNTFDEKRPILLYTVSDAGHGAGSSTEQALDLWAKSLVFRAHHTGLQI
jgi:prolyl oligopeptidase